MANLKFYWNGIKEDGGKLQKCHYIYRNWIPGIDPETVGITARDYHSFTAGIREDFTVKNETDIQTDYFDSDRIKVPPSHPLYAQVKAAYDAQEIHRNKRYEKRFGKVA